MNRTLIGLIAAVLLGSPITASAGDGYALTTETDTTAVSRISPDLKATEVTTPPLDTSISYSVDHIAYSSSSENFYFVLDGYEVAPRDTHCSNGTKFGIHADAGREGLIDQVKMAFLSGRKIKVHWNIEACTGGAPAPHYIKTYR